MNQAEQIQIQSLNIEEEFNNEVIWENKRDLFSKYFKTEINSAKARISLASVPENMTFEDAMKFLKNI